MCTTHLGIYFFGQETYIYFVAQSNQHCQKIIYFFMKKVEIGHQRYNQKYISLSISQFINNSNKITTFTLWISTFFDEKIKFSVRTITIFSNLWYKSGSVLKKRHHYVQ